MIQPCDSILQADSPASSPISDHQSPNRCAPTDTESPRLAWAVWLICLAVAAYGAVFIYLSSFVVEGRRYFCLFDDAMVSMRYAANWAAGHGLVWQPGERVEGFTNLAWTLLMGLVHRFTADGSQASLVMQVIGVGVVMGCAWATVRLARAGGLSPSTGVIAAILVAGQWNLLFFTLVGMETGLHALLVTLGLVSTVRSLRSGDARIAPMVWFAAALLVRPDVVIMVLLAAAFMAIGCARRRIRIASGLVIFAAVAGSVTLWRHWYYGEWLPNTYYLKATGWPLMDRLPVGLRTGFWSIVALCVPLLISAASLRRGGWWRIYLATAVAASLAYEVYIGGDAWPVHYRFVVPVSAALMVLAADGIGVIANWMANRNTETTNGGSHRSRITATMTAAALTAITLVGINVLHLRNWLLLERPIATLANRTSVRYAIAVDRIADPDATVAVTWAGAFPYFSNRTCYDMLGKCDAHIARLPAGERVKIAGHNKFDTRYTIDTYQPDLMVEGIRLVQPEFFEQYYPVVVTVDGAKLMFSVRKGSRRVTGGDRVTWSEAQEVFESTPRS